MIDPAPDLSTERVALRRSLARSTAAAVVVFLVAVGLAITAALSASKARRSQTEATENLWNALSAEAGADAGAESSNGSKQRTLDAIAAAVEIRPSPELRDRAIAALARTDLQPAGHFDDPIRERGDYFPDYFLSPDFSTYYLGKEDGTVVSFALPSGEPGRVYSEAEPPRYGGKVNYMFLSPDGRYLGMRYYYGAAVVWDTATGDRLFSDDIGREGTNRGTLAFHPRKSHLLAVSREERNEVRVFDLERSETVAKIEFDDGPTTMAYSLDGGRLAVEVGDEIHVLEMANEGAAPLATFTTPGGATEISWHPDGQRIAVGSGNDNIYLYQAATGQLLRTIRAHENHAQYTRVSPDGDLLLSQGWDNMTRLHDTESGQLMVVVRGQFPRQFNVDGRRIAGPSGRGLGVFEIDTSEVYKPLAGLRMDGYGAGILFGPDGTLLVAGGKNGLCVWDVASRRVLVEKPDVGFVFGCAFSTDGKWLVATTSDGRALRWPVNRDGGNELLGEMVESPIEGASNTSPTTLSVGGHWLGFGTGREGRAIDLRDPAAPPRTITREAGDDNNDTFVLSPDGRMAAHSPWRVASSTVWDSASGEQLAELPGPGGGAQFSPDNSLLAIVSKSEVLFWDTADWSLRESTPRPADAASFALDVAWSRDGRFVAATGESGKIQLIDGREATLGRTLAILKVPIADRIYHVTFSPDGTRLAATGRAGRCHLWDLAALEQELVERGLHWDDDGKTPRPADTKGAGAPMILAGCGGLAALVFGLFTLFYQRGLIRRFAAAEAIAEERTVELVDAKTQLAQSEKMKALGTLSAGVAHDFKNLLSVIRLSNDLIRRDAGERDDLLEEVDAIGNAVAQGDQVVKAMLGYSRTQTDDASVNVPDVIEGTVSLLGQQFLSGVRLQLEVARDIPDIDIPQGALEQILLNLAINASEAMGGKGELSIVARTIDLGVEGLEIEPRVAEHYIQIEIADDGPGMDRETLDRIFEPFFTTKTIGTEKGTGLGLATVYKIARDNGLGLGVESQKGNGTRFDLILPV